MSSVVNKIPTLAALQYRNYRIYWLGLLVAILGWQMLTFAQLWLVYELTNSTFYLGLAGGVNGVSNTAFSALGGVYADRLDKRRLLILTSSGLAVLSFALATLTALGLVNVWYVLALTALTGAVSAFDTPARQALLPHLIDDVKDLNNAVALASSVWSATRVIGPALAGALIALSSPAICFYITSFAYGIMVISLTRISLSWKFSPDNHRGLLSEFAEGWRFVLGNTVFLTLITMTFLNSIFGMSFIYLLPAFTKVVLAVGPSGYGFLMAAYGIGGVCGVITVASIGHHAPRGRLLITGCSLFSMLLVAFALSKSYAISLALIGLMGFFSSLYMTNVLTTLQAMVPDNLRGRVMGIYGLTWSLLPLGGMQAGFVATIVGTARAIIIGGLVILGFTVLVALFSRSVRNLAHHVPSSR